MMVTAEVRVQALERIRAFRLQLPVDYKFDRDEAGSRIVACLTPLHSEANDRSI